MYEDIVKVDLDARAHCEMESANNPRNRCNGC